MVVETHGGATPDKDSISQPDAAAHGTGKIFFVGHRRSFRKQSAAAGTADFMTFHGAPISSSE